MQCLIYTILPLLDIHLLHIFAIHLCNKVIILPPYQKFLNRGALPNLNQRLYCIFLHPLIIVKLLSHGHLPYRCSFGGKFGAEFMFL